MTGETGTAGAAGNADAIGGAEECVLGAHMQTTGGIQNALLEGKRIGCGCVQLFTTSPQQWKARALSTEQIEVFSRAHRETSLHPLVVHDSYLINLASPNVELREKSQRAFREEMERCESLGIHYLVTHCGACGEETTEQGLERLADSLSMMHRSSAGYRLRIALEVTAGQGTCLGFDFAHFRRVLELCEEPERLSICLDTCHAFAAGYDLRDAESYNRTIQAFDAAIGLKRLAVLHVNDCKKELGSRVDRHHHIGQGQIGPEAFRLLMRDERLKHIPKIVETPDFKLHGDNIRVLRDLAAVAEPIEDVDAWRTRIWNTGPATKDDDAANGNEVAG